MPTHTQSLSVNAMTVSFTCFAKTLSVINYTGNLIKIFDYEIRRNYRVFLFFVVDVVLVVVFFLFVEEGFLLVVGEN